MLGLMSPGVAQAACTITISTTANVPIQTDAYDDHPQCQNDLRSFIAGPVVTPPSHGSLIWGPPPTNYLTTFRYTPNPDFAGTDTFTFQSDRRGQDITVNITVRPTPPVSADGQATVAYNSAGNSIPLSFSGVAPTTVQVMAGPGRGTATVSGASILYTPPTGYVGADSFTYRGANSAGPSNTSTIWITVAPPPPPVATAWTAPAGPYNGAARTFSLAGQTSNGPTGYAVGSATTSGGGTVSIDAAGLVTYRPATGYRGADTFTYTATNPGGTSSPATVTVPVDDPVLAGTLTGSGAKAAVALSGYAVSPSGGRGPYTCATTVASGALPSGVSLNPDCSLGGTPTQGGAFSFSARVTDSSLGGGPFEQVVGTFSLSVQPPTPRVTIAAPANGGTVTTLDVTAWGTAQDATSVTLSFQGNSYGPISVTGGAWSQALPGPLTNGAYTLTAVSSNGTENSAVATSNFTVAVAAPAAPVITAPGADQLVVTQTPSLSGTATANTRITVREGSTVLATTTASSGGAWSVVSETLAQGRRTITATAADAAGNTSTPSSPVSFVVDTIAPPAPTINAPVNSQVIATPTPTLSGTAEAGATVTVRDGSTVLGTTTANGGGSWSLISTTLAEGPHSVSATATDAAGNIGPASTTVSFTVDAEAPSAPVIAAPVEGAALIQTTPTYTGTAEAGATVTVLVDGASVGTTVASGAGAWSKAQPTPLSLGAHTVRTTATDAAGNVSSASPAINFTVVAAPSATAQTLNTRYNTAVAITLTGANASNYLVVSNPAHGTLSGTAPNLTYTPTSGYSGSDSFQFTVLNAGGTSAPATVAITVGASVGVSITAPANGSTVIDPEGVTLRGAAQNATSVSLTVNGSRYGPIAVTGGSWSQILSPARLPNGAYSVSAVSTDGISESAPATAAFTVAAPTVTIVAPAAGGSIADPNAVTVRGTAENAASVQLTVNGAAYDLIPVVNGAWSQTLSPVRLSNGTYSLSALSISGAVSSPPATSSFTVAGPTVSITAPADGETTASRNLTVTGSAANAASVSLTFQNVVYGPIPVVGGAWSQALPGPLNGGAYGLTAVATNGGVSSAPVASTFSVSLSSDSRLASLVAPNVTLSPTFSPTTTAYSAVVTDAVATVTLVPTVNHAQARVTIGGLPVTSGQPSGPIGLVTGANSVAVVVTAADSSTSTYTIGIERLPAAPIATAVQAGVAYNSTGQVIALQPSGTFTGLTVVTAPAHGVVTVAGTTATYVPTAGYSGADSFTYVATGPGGTSAPATVSLTVALPGAPTVAATSQSVAYNSTGQTIVLQPSGVYAALAVATPPAHGVVTVAGTTATYVPTAGYSGPDSFTYVATGPGGTSAPASVAITVGLPEAPTAAAVSQSVGYNSTGQTIVLQPSGGFTILAIATAPNHGSVTVAGTTATYVPTAGYSGPDSFTYVATGPGGTSAPATVSISVVSPDVPTVSAVSQAVGYNSTGQIIPLQPSGVYSVIAVATAPTHGVVTVSGTTATYVPTGGYSGADSFTYVATGPGGTSAPATVSITVALPGAPTVAAVSQTVGYSSSGQAIILQPAGVFTALTIATAPIHGVVTLAGTTATYVPNAGHFGTDSFTYVATGPGGASAPAAVSISVGLPSAPTVAAGRQAVAFNSAGQAITLQPSGVYTTLAVAAAPTQGVVTIVGTTATYVPTTGYSGADSFTYVATGPGGTSAPARVDLTVAAPPPPVIIPPTTPIQPTSPTGSGSATIELGTSASGEIEGYRVTTEGLHGSAVIETTTVGTASAKAGAPQSAPAVSFRLVYTPRPEFMGVDSVTLVAFGPGGVSAPATFTFHVAGKAPDLVGRTASGQAVSLSPTGLTGGPFEGLRITRAPGFGTAVVQGLTIVFTPGLAEAGDTSLDYVIRLPFGESAAGRIDLTSGLSPTAPSRSVRTLQGRPVTVRLTDGAQGGPFTGAAVTQVTPANSVSARITATGAGAYDVTVTPEADFSGEAVIAYSLTNSQGTAAGRLTVSVEARPDPALDPDVSALASGQIQSARRFADSQIDNVQQRLGRLHHGDNRSSNGLSLNAGQGDVERDPRLAALRRLGAADTLPGDREVERERELIALSARARPDDRMPGASAASDDPQAQLAVSQAGAGDGARSIGVWTSGSIDWGRQDASGVRDSRFTTQGVTVGVDAVLTDTLTLGAAAGYGEDTTRSGSEGTRSEATAVSGMVYGSWRPAEGLYIDGMAGYSDLSFDSRRWASGLDGEADAFALGARSGELRFLSGALGRTGLVAGASSDVYARLDVRRIDLDAFVETGAGLASLSWEAVSQDSVSASLGGVMRWTVETRRHGLIKPEVRLEWSHEFEGLNDQIVRYADWAASPRYRLAMDGWSRDALRLNLGGEWTLSERLMARLGYRGALGDAGHSHGVELGFTVNW